MERRHIHNVILVVILMFVGETAFSQRPTVRIDSIHIYKKIENYSNKSKFTRFAYNLVFRSYTVKPRKKKPIQKPYSGFEGKFIRRITIVTLDPFGNSIGDTIDAHLNFLSKAGNSMHLKTQSITIRNLLLIRPKQRFDSLLVKESERLVRSRPFIRDVSFFVKTVSAKSDSVDIAIRVLDNWSIIPEVHVSPVSTTFNLTDQNFLGTGHEFMNGISRDIPHGMNTYRTNYSVPNISNTYVSATLHYETDGNNNFNKSVVIDRPFYSTFAKWAGGISVIDMRLVQSPLNFRTVTEDYWAGQAQQLTVGNSVEKRLTNFITTTRYLHVRYLEKPLPQNDPLHFFSNETFFLTGIGLSNRKYVQDKYLFKYGITEDVPVGKVYALTGGYQTKNFVNRLFWGARFSTGNYYPWGYLSSNVEYETFVRHGIAEEGIFNADMKFFTNLFEIGKWKFRQFVKPQLTVGINRFASDSLTLNDGFGIDGFSSTKLSGSSRFLLSFQTQAYAPWDFIGFRFGPFFTYSLGVLGNAKFSNSKTYSQFGFGVLIKNENLILNTFQFSFSFYPIMPGNGSNVLKMNSFKTTDFGFSNFEVGKPGPRVFQ